MKRRRAEWLDLVRGLGRAVTEMVSAELEALSADLGRSGRTAGIAAGLLGAAAFLAFWLLGTLVFAAIAIVSIWLPVWGAALVVSALILVVIGSLAGVAVLKIKALETPAETVRRRWDDHRNWWHERVLGDEQAALDAAVETLGEGHEPAE